MAVEVIEEEFLGISKRGWVIGIIVTIVWMSISAVMLQTSNKPGETAGLVISYFYIFLINEIIGRINPKWRLNAQELTALVVAIMISLGIWYWTMGAGEEMWYSWGPYLNAIGGLAVSPTKEFWSNIIPPYVMPLSVIEGAWEGLGAPNWGAWFAPFVFWIVIYYLSFTFLNLSIAFISAQHFVHVERLPFPEMIPIATHINMWTDIDEKNKSKIFDTKKIETKIYWISFALSLAVFAPIIGITTVLPVLRIAYWWGCVPFTIPGMADVLPGALNSGVFSVYQFFFSLFLSNATLLTVIVTWVGFGVIYNYVGTVTGLLPYTPGIESYSSYYFGSRPPFPYRTAFPHGMLMGFGILLIWLIRHRLVLLWKSLKGEQIVEFGANMRTIAIIFVSSAIVFIIGWTAAGVPLPIMFMLFLVQIIYSIAQIRVSAEFYDYRLELAHQWPVFYQAGSALGLWPFGVVPTPSGGLAMSMFTIHSYGISNIDSFMASWVQANVYSLGYRTRTRLGDLMKVMMVFATIGCIVFFVMYTLAVNHIGGMSKSATIGSLTSPSSFYVMSTGGMPGGLTFETWNLTFAIGFFIPFIVHLIRSRFPLFFWSTPAFLMTLHYMDWMWPPALFGLIFKIILTRAIGTRRYFQYITPITAGACTSVGILSLLDTFWNLFTYQIPFIQTWYIP